jgi:hypothetical protein
MDFSFYEPNLYQSQNFMDKQGNNFIVLNFMSHSVEIGIFPENYFILDLPMNLNIHADNLDLTVLNFVKDKLKEMNINVRQLKPIVILPPFQPIQFLIYEVVSELFNSKHPIIARIAENKNSLITANYFVGAGMRKRFRELRPEIKSAGLVVK